MSYLLFYVDDILLIASSDEFRQSIISLLSLEFSMKDLGHLSYFLGIAVTLHAGCSFLSQNKYATEIIERAGMSSCKVSPSPVDTKLKLSSITCKPFEDPSLYRSLSGALNTLRSQDPILYMQYNIYVYSCMTRGMNTCTHLSAFCATYRVQWISVFTCSVHPHPLLFVY